MSIADPRYWQAIDIVNYEDLFTGDERSLRSRLSGRAVVIGQMIPPQDRYLTRNGEEIYGCQVHAAALDQLLVTGLPQTFAWKDLVWRTLIWSFGAGLAVSLLRPPRRVGLGVQAALCTLVLVVSVGTALYISVRVRDVLFVHVGVAAATFLATFAVTYLLKAIRTQQLRLAPQAIRYSAADPRDAPSTILAQTR